MYTVDKILQLILCSRKENKALSLAIVLLAETLSDNKFLSNFIALLCDYIVIKYLILPIIY